MKLVLDIDQFEERAAIAEYNGGLTRKVAKVLAAQRQGFDDVAHFMAVLAEYVLTGRLP